MHSIHSELFSVKAMPDAPHSRSVRAPHPVATFKFINSVHHRNDFSNARTISRAFLHFTQVLPQTCSLSRFAECIEWAVMVALVTYRQEVPPGCSSEADRSPYCVQVSPLRFDRCAAA